VLSKTAMALVPAFFASWRCRARANYELGTVGREPRVNRRQLSLLPKTPPTASVGKTALPPIRAPKERCTITTSSSVAKVGE